MLLSNHLHDSQKYKNNAMCRQWDSQHKNNAMRRQWFWEENLGGEGGRIDTRKKDEHCCVLVNQTSKAYVGLGSVLGALIQETGPGMVLL